FIKMVEYWQLQNRKGETKMKFIESIKTCFKKYATFSGRASRSEYWWWVLFTVTTFVAINFITLFGDPTAGLILGCLFTLLAFLPGFSVAVRRLHDTNNSGWWLIPLLAIAIINSLDSNEESLGIFALIAIAFIMVYPFLLFIAYCRKGTNGDNRFGKDPLQN
ncbi:MAG: DUF805 domain-containing protein, partial [Rickettsiales bacterium]